MTLLTLTDDIVVSRMVPPNNHFTIGVSYPYFQRILLQRSKLHEYDDICTWPTFNRHHVTRCTIRHKHPTQTPHCPVNTHLPNLAEIYHSNPSIVNDSHLLCAIGPIINTSTAVYPALNQIHTTVTNTRKVDLSFR